MKRKLKLLNSLIVAVLILAISQNIVKAQEFESGGIKYKVLPEGNNVEVIPKNIDKYSGFINIPNSVSDGTNNYTVTSIGASAFFECFNLTDIIISNSIKTIKHGNFISCNKLTQINIPASVNKIENPSNFTTNGALKILTVSSGNSKYSTENNVLYNKNKTILLAYARAQVNQEFNVPTSVKKIGKRAFFGVAKIKKINIPGNVDTIGIQAFASMQNLEEVNITGSVKVIEQLAFDKSKKLTKVSLGTKLVEIGQQAFFMCLNLKGIELPKSLRKIKKYAFEKCTSLDELFIPGSVQIGEGVFEGCSQLKTINIPSASTTLYRNTFKGCENLETIYSPKTNANYIDGNQPVFEDVPTATCKVYVPKNSASSYKAANQWKDFTNIIEVEIALNEHEKDLEIGTTFQLTVNSVTPAEIGTEVSWKSSDNDIATVDEDGNVTAKKLENTYITATTQKYGYTDTCLIRGGKKELEVLLKDRIVKIYDGNNIAYSKSKHWKLLGLNTGDNVRIKDVEGTYNNKNAGNNKTVTFLNLQLEGEDANKYKLKNKDFTGIELGDIKRKDISVSLQGSIKKEYDGNNTATLKPENYKLDGIIAGDNVGIGNTSGTYDSKNAGQNKTVTVSGLDPAGEDKSNYSFTQTSVSNNIGEIEAKKVTLNINAGVLISKTYDGTAAVNNFTSDHYYLDGLILPDNPTVSWTSIAYEDKNVSDSKTLIIKGLSLSGTGSENYKFADTEINLSGVGKIIAQYIDISIKEPVSKIYDGTTTATLKPENYKLEGMVSGDNLTLNVSSGNYNDKEVGEGKYVMFSGLSLSGADEGNYILNTPDFNDNNAIIKAKEITVELQGNISKIYDGTNSATLKPNNYKLDGVIVGDNVGIGNTLGTYDSKNAGQNKTVTVSSLDSFGEDAHNYTFTPNTVSAAIGEITQKKITVSLQNTVAKTYDGNNTATLTADNYNITGKLDTDNDVTLNNPTSGTYDNKNVGTNKAVTVTGLALLGNDDNNYELAATEISQNIGEITQLNLTVSLTGTISKEYDGNDIATLQDENYLFDNLISGDNVTLEVSAANYNNKNVGTNKPVTVRGLAISGTDAENYNLQGNNIIQNIGEITPKKVSVQLSNISKEYDGTDKATLTPDNYQLTGIEITATTAVTLNNPTNGTFDNKNVGANKVVTVTGLALLGNDDNNYELEATEISQNIGEITAKELNIALKNTPVSKEYDGTNTATLTNDNIDFLNLVENDKVSVKISSATYNDKNAGINKPVKCVIAGLLGDDANNYSLAVSELNNDIGEITAKVLVAKLQNTISKEYDGNNTATLTADNYTLIGKLGADNNVTLNTTTNGTYDNKNIGLNKVVTVKGLTLLGNDDNNYELETTEISQNIGEITAKELNIALKNTPVSKEYDGTNIATLTNDNIDFLNLIENDKVNVNISSATYNDKNAGIKKPVKCVIAGLLGDDANNYSLSVSELNNDIGEITAKELNIALKNTPVSKEYDGTNIATLTNDNIDFVNLVENDKVSLKISSATYNDKNAGINKPVKCVISGLLGDDANNYSLAVSELNNDIGEITAKILVAKLQNTISKEYDGNNTATLTADNYTLIGKLDADNDVTLNNTTSGTYDNKNVGTNKLVTCSGLALSGANSLNYTLEASTISGNIGNITAKNLQVTANPQSKKYGNNDPALTYSTDITLFRSDRFTGSLSREEGEDVGEYSITQGSLSAGNNYIINFKGSIFTITKSEQVINWAQNLKLGCDNNYNITLTASASSGLDVTYELSNNNVATINDNILNLSTNPGNLIITAKQEGNKNYFPATPVQKQVDVKLNNLVTKMWNDVLVFDNTGNNYVKWQWYKNGNKEIGATKQYYGGEKVALNGTYYVQVTDKDGNVFETCPIKVDANTEFGSINVSPNPIRKGEKFKIVANYNDKELEGAILYVVTLQGNIINQIAMENKEIEIAAPQKTGMYIVRLILSNKTQTSVNIIVK